MTSTTSKGVHNVKDSEVRPDFISPGILDQVQSLNKLRRSVVIFRGDFFLFFPFLLFPEVVPLSFPFLSVV